jgi:hypothetical protein
VWNQKAKKVLRGDRALSRQLFQVRPFEEGRAIAGLDQRGHRIHQALV